MSARRQAEGQLQRDVRPDFNPSPGPGLSFERRNKMRAPNLTSVDNRVSPSTVRQAIEAALRGNAEIDPRGSQVSTYDNTSAAAVFLLFPNKRIGSGFD